MPVHRNLPVDPQRWYPGTVVTMTLQRAKAAPTDPERSIAVNAKVVVGKDGAGLTYVLFTYTGDYRYPANETDAKALQNFLDRLNADMVALGTRMT